MKLIFFLVLFLILTFSAQAQNQPANDGPCRVMEIHCQCENPHRDFIVPNQKAGKFNSTEPGVCQSSKDINNLLKSHPDLYCRRGSDYQKDPTNNETNCTSTWRCKEPCTIKEIGTRYPDTFK